MPSLVLFCRLRRGLAGARRTVAALGDPFLPERVMRRLRGAARGPGTPVPPEVAVARLAAIAAALARRDAIDARGRRPALEQPAPRYPAMPAAGLRR